ncbi:unnamed protein product [Medioppia subpectinata]|uniref:protein-tyrosine-phosphatase n=1 Tax=Medioppia subpectinata TaxID=1979941 RepID=A0A7R9KBX5_9ACAR|nr:unnamed protein product [Medioppia subpectinata]CAG2100477.1 unnamed protein product [Medioppia subpectinata]
MMMDGMQISHNPHHRDIDKIDEWLYLGNQYGATNAQTLSALHITDILTVMSAPIDAAQRIAGIRYHHIAAEDNSSQDLLSHFNRAYDTIEGCRRLGCSILVHCRVGVSRSATIIIGYIMRKRRQPLYLALEWVKTRRPIIHPNREFKSQLRLFERMGYRLNANNRQFRELLLRVYANRQRLDEYFERRAIVESQTPDLAYGQQLVCKDCGFALFSQIHIHRDYEEIHSRSESSSSGEASTAAPVAGKMGNDSKCQRIYIEPQEWMAWELSQCQHSYGMVKCRCDALVAEYDVWTPGALATPDRLPATPQRHHCFKIRVLDKSFKFENNSIFIFDTNNNSRFNFR